MVASVPGGRDFAASCVSLVSGVYFFAPGYTLKACPTAPIAVIPAARPIARPMAAAILATFPFCIVLLLRNQQRSSNSFPPPFRRSPRLTSLHLASPLINVLPPLLAEINPLGCTCVTSDSMSAPAAPAKGDRLTLIA